MRLFTRLGKDKNKKNIDEALIRYEKHRMAGKSKIKLFSFLENGTEKNLQQSAVERDKPNTKLVLVIREPLLNKPNKQNVYEIDSFNKRYYFKLI